MSLQVGFSEVDITPPLGTHKIGWLRDIVADRVRDPLFARAAVLEADGERVAFVQLDTLCIRWTQVNDIRTRCADACGFAGDHLMVAATHNHAGPAVANCGDVARDDAYVETLVGKVVDGIGQALDGMQEARIGFGSGFEFDLTYNRRMVMRDGAVKTHGTFKNPMALCLEGPVDPEVAVMAARDKRGRLLGVVVNFACHPTDHGGETAISAGWPGVLAHEMKGRGCPATVFLNGASGNIAVNDPRAATVTRKEAVGAALARDVSGVLETMDFRDRVKLAARGRTIQLPFRETTAEERAGRIKGAQRFIDSAIYDRHMEKALSRVRRLGTQPAEVQVIAIDEYAYVGIPAEYFVQLGLRIKEQSHPCRALVVGHANGMLGYVPHRDAFLRGGYETTYWDGSRLAPEAGDLLADAAIELIQEACGDPPGSPGRPAPC